MAEKRSRERAGWGAGRPPAARGRTESPSSLAERGLTDSRVTMLRSSALCVPPFTGRRCIAPLLRIRSGLDALRPCSAPVPPPNKEKP